MRFNRIIHGDALEVARALPGELVQAIITSPPYYGLRNYGEDGQWGNEDSIGEYVGKLRELFRELRRVLKEDGTLWLNLGDSYSGLRKKTGVRTGHVPYGGVGSEEIPPKNLMGIPWRVALALQEDGWILRSDIIWHKSNPVPESVKDRPTKSHEYLFLLAKNPRYYYNYEAVQVQAKPSSIERGAVYFGGEKGRNYTPSLDDPNYRGGKEQWGRLYEGTGEMVNMKDVLTCSTANYPDAHFATFPEKLIIPCVLAGSREGDVIYDPFMGAGTTAVVSRNYQRRYLGSEVNKLYIHMAEDRIGGEASIFDKETLGHGDNGIE